MISNMADLRELRVYIKFSFKLEKKVAEMQHMLKEAFDNEAMSQIQTYKQFKISKIAEHPLKMTQMFWVPFIWHYYTIIMSICEKNS